MTNTALETFRFCFDAVLDLVDEFPIAFVVVGLAVGVGSILAGVWA